ncbi:MAG TPA: ADP-ribosylglycohydrolase family protein [Halomicronema sp.]
MRYSLLSRFEGCLLGALVAERLGAAYEANAIDMQNSVWFGVGNKSLISGFRIKSEGISLQKNTAEILIKDGFLQKSFWQSLGEKNNLDAVDVVLGILPLILYLHDQELKKKLSLHEACVNLSKGEFTEQMVVVLGYSISLALQEKLRASRLIGQMVARLEQEFGGESVLGQQLSKIQPVLESNGGLEQLERVVKQDAVKSQTMVGGEILGQMLSVARALDSFVAYSEDFRLCVMRALRTGKSPRLSALFAGALAGAYGGVGSIPVAWSEGFCGLELGWEGMPVSEMARRLFAAWSGVYQNQGSMIETNRFGAVAASELLRRR